MKNVENRPLSTLHIPHSTFGLPFVSGLKVAGIGAILGLACVLPFLVSSYRVFQLTQTLAYAVAILGLNIVTGFNGQISLGHGAFYAIGAYCAAILMEQFGVPYWLCIPAAGFVSLTTGFAFGLPALRLEGPYLALATFALAAATPQLLKYDRLEPWTGGVQGIVVTKPNPPSWLPLDQDQWLYFFTLAVVVSMFAGGAKLLAGRIGRAMVAIRDHPIAAQAMGVNVSLVKSMTFGVSAMYTGVAGALGAIVVQFVAPDSFTLFLSIVLLAGAVIGGLTSTSGAFYGAMFIQFVPDMADQISKAAPWAVYGVLLIVFMYVMPTGVAGFLRLVAYRVRGRRW